MSVARALFTRDLRVHDNPVLAAGRGGTRRRLASGNPGGRTGDGG
jgi:hypothetical protein